MSFVPFPFFVFDSIKPLTPTLSPNLRPGRPRGERVKKKGED
jgi:hypothetical protein